ncbi:MAG: tetratricopeptide repeat protein [Acidobacteria bacterium]|nr:MAG: tetratricopeptide repeat protein [Acidobacteriota bacterium]
MSEALDICQKVLGEDHVDTAEVRAALGHCLNQLEDDAATQAPPIMELLPLKEIAWPHSEATCSQT